MRLKPLIIAPIALSIVAGCSGAGKSANPLPPGTGTPGGVPAASAAYSVTLLPPAGSIFVGRQSVPCDGQSAIALLNDDRVVYGTTCTLNGAGQIYTLVYDPVSGTSLELPSHVRFAQAANQQGDVVAFYYGDSGWRAIRYVGSTCGQTELPPTSMFFGINDLGDAVGFTDPQPFSDCRDPRTCTNHHAIVQTLAGTISDLDPSAPFSEAYSINNAGTALGVIYDTQAQKAHSVLFQPRGAITDLTALIAGEQKGGAPRFSIGYRINNQGHAIVAEGYTPPTGRQSIVVFASYFFDGTAMHRIPALTGDESTLMTGLNNNDVAVGYSCRDILETASACTSVIFRNGVTTPVADLLPAPYNAELPSGSQLDAFSNRMAINDKGQILINAAIGYGSTRLLLLTPAQ